MLRAVAETLHRHLLTRFPADRPYARAQFHAEPMPPPAAHFLSQVLEGRLAMEATQLRSDWFDFTAPEVRASMEAFLAALARTARIPADEWSRTLEQAVRLVVMHLVRPAYTLAAFVFGEHTDPLPLRTIRRRLAYFSAYPYLGELATGYFERKEISRMGREEFFELLARLDRRMVEEYETDDWIRLLEPLFDLLRLASPVRGEAGIPVPLLRAFFEDKGRTELRRRLLFEEQLRGRRALDEEALRRLLDAPADEYAARETVRPAAPAIHSVYRSRPTGEPAGPESPVPLWKRFADARQRPPAPSPAPEEPELSDDDRRLFHDVHALTPVAALEPDEADVAPPSSRAEQWTVEPAPEADLPAPDLQPPAVPAAAAPADAPPGAAGPPEPVPLWRHFAEARGEAPAGPAPAAMPAAAAPAPESFDAVERRVLGELSRKRRAWFVKHLFGGEEQEYERILRLLAASKNWAEAAQIIAEEVFQKRALNIYSEPAVTFTDEVEARLRRED